MQIRSCNFVFKKQKGYQLISKYKGIYRKIKWHEFGYPYL
jgi:hypothetical protein